MLSHFASLTVHQEPTDILSPAANGTAVYLPVVALADFIEATLEDVNLDFDFIAYLNVLHARSHRELFR